MKFHGFTKSDLTNYPSLIACSIWLKGCNFVCPYCHNPMLVGESDECGQFDEEEIFDFLEKRKNFLEGIVISGGESTIHRGIIPFLQKLRSISKLKIKLDTNLTSPNIVEQIISDNLVDFIAGDIKSPFDKYSIFLKNKNEQTTIVENIRKSLEIIDNSDVDFELRTTCVKSLLEYNDFPKMKLDVANSMENRNINWFLQVFKNNITLSPDFKSAISYTTEELKQISTSFLDNKFHIEVR